MVASEGVEVVVIAVDEVAVVDFVEEEVVAAIEGDVVDSRQEVEEALPEVEEEVII